MTRSTLEELLARCERATGPDREIDLDMMAAFLPRHRVIEAMGIDDLMRFPQTWQSDVGWRDAERVAYTSSLDAIVGLIEAQLPGVFWHIAKGKLRASEPLFGAALFFGADEELGHGESAGAPALALAAAFLRAKLSSPGGDE